MLFPSKDYPFKDMSQCGNLSRYEEDVGSRYVLDGVVELVALLLCKFIIRVIRSRGGFLLVDSSVHPW